MSNSTSAYILPINRVMHFADRLEGEQLYRLIALFPKIDSAVVFGLHEGNTRPEEMPYSTIARGLLAQSVSLDVDDPSEAFVRPDSQLSENEKTERDRRHDIIAPLVVGDSTFVLSDEHRGSVIAKRAQETNVQRNKVYLYLSLWWRHGQIPNALAPQFSNRGLTGNRLNPGAIKRGRPRMDINAHLDPGINVDAEIKKKLLHGIRYLHKGLSYPQAYEKVLNEYFRERDMTNGAAVWKIPEHGIPTIDQFRYHIGSELGRGDILCETLGDTKFARKYRARVGTARDLAFGPASVYQMDATIGNFYLRSKRFPDRIIGRPVIYFVIDHYSHMIVGLHVDLTGPSWEAAQMALEMTFTDKVAYCAKFGVEITEDMWPTSICQTLTGDRGWEYIGENAKSAAHGLGYNIKALPPYRPDYKGLVEGKFEMVDHEQIRWMPGATHPMSRGDKKCKLDMVHTIESFTAAMIHWILRYNETHRIASPPMGYESPTGANPSPIEVWKHGVENYGGIRMLNRDFIRANLLHVGAAKETDKGLRFNQLYYVPSQDNDLTDFVRVPGRKWRSPVIKYDPRDVSKILMPGRGTDFREFILSDSSCQYAGFTLQEVKDDLQQIRTASKANVIPDMNKRAATQRAQDAIEDKTRGEMSDIINTTKFPSANREARQQERRDIQRSQTGMAAPGLERADTYLVPQPFEAPPAVSSGAPTPIQPSASGAPSHLALLQAAHAKQRLLEGQK